MDNVALLSLKPFSMSLRLLLVTVAVIAAFFAATYYANRTASSIDSMAEDIAGNADPSIRYLGAARTELHAVGATLTSSVLEVGGAGLRQQIEVHEARMHRDLEAYTSLPAFPTERGRWDAAALDLEAAEAQADALVARIEAGDRAGAVALRAGAVADALRRADLAIDGLIAFDADQGSRLSTSITSARRRAQRVSYALDGLAAVLALALGSAAIAASRAVREADRRTASRLRAAAEAAVAISESVGRSGAVRDVLQTAIERARPIAAADLAAIGIGRDPSQRFDPFVADGVAPDLLERLGAPRPRGLLGVPLAHRRTVRVDDVTRDGRVLGLPDGHPAVGPLLGVAVRSGHEVIGHLYLGRAPGAPGFSDDEVGVIELLAEFLASALQNASLYASLRDEVKAREDLLSIVSHDLRNPLSAITMAAALAQKSLGDEGAVPLARHVDMIARNAGRMDRMIGELLTAAKLHEGKLSVEPKAEDAAALAREAVETLADVASSKAIDLGCAIEEGLPPVYCDGPRVAQVLSNLIGNALKFTPPGGSIIVSVERGPGASPEVCFSVKDTGVGIPDDVLPHVFDRYWQKKEHAARGTGLGLFISKGLVEAHRGRIWVTSRVGEGSDFRFALAAADDRPAAPPQRSKGEEG